MSASLMRARIATRVLAGMYENAPTLLTSAIRLSVELPGAARNSGPPFPFTFAVSPAWCSGLEGARLVGAKKLDVAWINPSIIELGGEALDSPGLDLLAVFIGSEGMLGIVTEVTVRLLPRPPAARVIMASFDDVV